VRLSLAGVDPSVETVLQASLCVACLSKSLSDICEGESSLVYGLTGFVDLRGTSFVAGGGVTRCCSTYHVSTSVRATTMFRKLTSTFRRAQDAVMRGSRLNRCHCVACRYAEVRTRLSVTVSAAARLTSTYKALLRLAVRLKMLYNEVEL
jgi:hypothetical protein